MTMKTVRGKGAIKRGFVQFKGTRSCYGGPRGAIGSPSGGPPVPLAVATVGHSPGFNCRRT